MAWPTTKASNQYTDSGQDRIADARAEINQNITNVNDIIDEFNISSPSNGDLLQYSSTSGQWEPIAGSAVGQTKCFLFKFTSTFSTGSAQTYTGGITTLVNQDTGISVTGSNFSIPEGDYTLEALGDASFPGTSFGNIDFIDDSSAGSAITFRISGTSDYLATAEQGVGSVDCFAQVPTGGYNLDVVSTISPGEETDIRNQIFKITKYL